ncbi:MAG: hypothetical protein N3B14_02145 [Thermoleophilia bacterium]|nr:hypothetical protein [Thermoleophilia bacterium]
MPKKYAHLIKKCIVRESPPGLYPQKLIWMEGKDMEGFNAQFCYGFIKEPGTLHPIEGMVVHPYDECIVFAGYQDGDIRRMEAEISIQLGPEGEVHTFHKPTVVCVPKGLPHGPATVHWVDRPIAHFIVALDPEYKAETLPAVEPTKGDKYAHLIKPLRCQITESIMKSMSGDEQVQGPTYADIMDEDGILHPAEKGVGPGNGDEIVWLFGDNLEGFNVNFSWGTYTQCGKWHRGGEVHVHPEAEILCYLGLDPDNLEYLGAELELGMGKERERHVFNTPTIAVCPEGFPHLPLITRWVDKRYAFSVVCLSGEHASPWVEVEEEDDC